MSIPIVANCPTARRIPRHPSSTYIYHANSRLHPSSHRHSRHDQRVKYSSSAGPWCQSSHFYIHCHSIMITSYFFIPSSKVINRLSSETSRPMCEFFDNFEIPTSFPKSSFRAQNLPNRNLQFPGKKCGVSGNRPRFFQFHWIPH